MASLAVKQTHSMTLPPLYLIEGKLFLSLIASHIYFVISKNISVSIWAVYLQKTFGFLLSKLEIIWRQFWFQSTPVQVHIVHNDINELLGEVQCLTLSVLCWKNDQTPRKTQFYLPKEDQQHIKDALSLDLKAIEAHVYILFSFDVGF